MIGEIISIGNELLTGLVVNTNAARIGEVLTRIGCKVQWISSVGDHDTEIASALEKAISRASVVIVTGGLGPTEDDVTVKAVLEVFGCETEFHPEIMEKLESVFRKQGRLLPPCNRKQAFLPKGAELLPNPVGSAFGFIMKKGNTECFFLPGVPSEVDVMMKAYVLPRLKNRKDRLNVQELSLRTFGIPESALGEKLARFSTLFPEIQLGFFPEASGVRLRLLYFGDPHSKISDRFSEAQAFVYEQVGQWIYGTGEETLEQVVGKLLSQKHLTIGIAESCTGGLICNQLTNVSGSSAYVKLGVVAYSNQAKVELLGIPEVILAKHGAVSKETAKAMAEGIRQVGKTDIGLSTTGISGPSGGTEEKPVGLVYIGYVDEKHAVVKQFLFSGDRLWHKARSSYAALDLVRRMVLGIPEE